VKIFIAIPVELEVEVRKKINRAQNRTLEYANKDTACRTSKVRDKV